MNKIKERRERERKHIYREHPSFVSMIYKILEDKVFLYLISLLLPSVVHAIYNFFRKANEVKVTLLHCLVPTVWMIGK